MENLQQRVFMSAMRQISDIDHNNLLCVKPGFFLLGVLVTWWLDGLDMIIAASYTHDTDSMVCTEIHSIVTLLLFVKPLYYNIII